MSNKAIKFDLVCNLFLAGVFLCLLVTAPCFSKAQGDKQSLAKKFVQILNVYKTSPVHLVINIQKSSNLVFGPSDTMYARAEFYVYKGHSSYLKMGNVEQVANDSVTVFVQNNIRRVSVYTNKTAALPAQPEWLVPSGKSDIKKILSLYNITDSLGSGVTDTALMEIYSRTMVGDTLLPVSSMQIFYSKTTSMPLKVVQVGTALLKIDSAKYTSFAENPAYSGKIIAGKNGGHFVVRQKSVTCTYTDVAFDDAKPIPLLVSDCVIKNAIGQYQLSNRFNQYVLSSVY